MAYYLFTAKGDAAQGPTLRELAAELLGAGMWGIGADEPHATRLHPATSSSSMWVRPSDAPSGVSLGQVEEWAPPVPMMTVLSQLAPSENAKADFQAGVVRITATEYETTLAVTAGLRPQ